MIPFPLQWPSGTPRTSRPQSSPFGRATQTLGRCRDTLIAEVERLRATTLVISTNLPVKLDGLFRADARLVKPDAGVAVYFTHPTRGKLVIACDKWNTVAANLWSIARTLENLRQIRRWGTAEMADKALGGFAGALPHLTPETPWWVVLQFKENEYLDISTDVIEQRAREMSKRYHPDSPMGGDAERFKLIREALVRARESRGVAESVVS